MTDDIVTAARFAAEEIERLRAEVVDLRVTSDRQWTQLNRDIAKLRAERDEARREICINEANDLAFDLERKGVFGITGKSMAEKRGWDCFKEDGK